MDSVTHGKVVRFDEATGYGIIRTIEGDEAHFHASALQAEFGDISPGTEVSFRLRRGPVAMFALEVRRDASEGNPAALPDWFDPAQRVALEPWRRRVPPE